MGSIKLEWETDFYPTHGHILKEQERRGWHPAGYGEPYSIKIDKVEKVKDRWKTVWYCRDSCE